jgi:3-deoxy-D-manno-octulosonic-acid transferase
MKYLLNFIYILALMLYGPVIVYKALKQGRYRIGWAERFGKIKLKSTDKPCIWIHAVSMGEVNSTKSIIQGLQDKLPQYSIAISTTTDTGYARATAMYADKHSVFFFPFDFSFVMKRAFKNIKPALCILVELELWPNFIQTCKDTNVPIMVVNGRISDRSFPSYKKIKRPVSRIFRNLTLVLAQTDEYAQRFIYLGCEPENVITTGSLKYDTAQVADNVAGADVIADKLNISNQHLIVAGGTGPGEEKIMLDVYKNLIDKNVSKNLRLAVVPRKPERFDEVAAIIEQAGFASDRYSRYKADDKLKSQSADSVILVDTMGDLRKFYSLSKISFVGRSLVPMVGTTTTSSL